MRAAGGGVRTRRNENWLSEGDPCVFPRMSPCAHPPDQPQIGSYWGMQGMGWCGAAGVESQRAGAQLGNETYSHQTEDPTAPSKATGALSMFPEEAV